MQFLLNYLFLFLVLIIIGIGLFSLSLYILSDRYDLGSLDFDISKIYTELKSNDLDYAYLNSNLPKGSYIEIIDDNLVVQSQVNSIHSIGYKYNQAFFNRILINYYPEYSFYYPDSEDEILLIVTPEFDQGYKFLQGLAFALIIVLICLVIAMIIYSKFTSVIFLKPIESLLDGVHSLSTGNYATRIDFKSRNELGTLRDAFNDMAQRIQDEIQLREKSEANRKQVIMDVSHDLKTPLTNILGYTETLMNNPDLDESAREKYLKVVHVNSQRANNLIRNLFELSRLEIESKEAIMKPVDICEFTRKIIISYINDLEANQMTYEFIIPEKELFCSINPEQLERAISNIIINSIKHSGKNTHVIINLTKYNTHIKLSIEDNGKGIPNHLSNDIFDPFFRTDRSRNSKTGGTGLGLAISKAIVEKHLGHIYLDKEFENGCRFVMEIPCVPCTSQTTEKES